MANQDSYALNPVTPETVILGYEASNPKRTRNYSATEIGETTIWGTIEGSISNQTDLYDWLTDLQGQIDNLPLQFNPIAGTNITITGTYPNITFNAKNLATDNLLQTSGATRVYDINSGRLAFLNGSRIQLVTNSLPSAAASSILLTGFGDTSADKIIEINNQNGNLTTWYGDGNIEHLRNIGVGVAPVSNRKIFIEATGSIDGVYSISNNGNAGRFASTNGIGVNSSGTTSVNGVGSNIGGFFIGNGSYGVVGEGTQYGGYFYPNAASGWGMIALQNGFEGAIKSTGKIWGNTTGSFGTNESSALVQYDSTTKGILIPRMTTSERLAIILLTDSLQVYDTDLKKYMFWNPTFGWVGMDERSVAVQATGITLGLGSLWYFGNVPTFPTTTIGNRSFKAPFTGKITKCFVRLFIAGAIGDRLITVSIRINNTTDYLVAAITPTTVNVEFINLAMNTTGIPVTENVTDIVLKAVATGGTTDTVNAIFGGQFIIQ